MATITDITEEFVGDGFKDPLTQEEVVTNLNRQQTPQAEIVGDEAPLPEADFGASTSSNNNTNNTTQNSGNNQQQASEPKFNSEFDSLPKEEQEEGAEQTAELAIYGYCQLKLLIPKAVGISEKSLKKLEKKGDIDLSIPVKQSPSNPRPTTILNIVEQFNESIKKPYETADQFKEAVKPLLVSIFKKKGVALSPEHLLGILVIQDVVGTAITTARCMADRRELINDLKEIKEAYSKNNIPTTQQTASTQSFGTSNRTEPEEERVRVNPDAEIIGEQVYAEKAKREVTIEEISAKVAEREAKKAERKSAKRAYNKVKTERKKRTVVKATGTIDEVIPN